MTTGNFTNFPVPWADKNSFSYAAYSPGGVPRTILARTAGAAFVDITEFGAIGDGVFDNSDALHAFQAWAQGKRVVLYFPAGNYKTLSAEAWMVGMKELVIWAYGATLDWISLASGTGFSQAFGTNAKVASTDIGNLSVTLLTPADASRFAVGDWVALGSLEMQCDHGYPPNLYNCEYKQISSIVGAVISFQSDFPGLDNRVRYVNLSTYPDFGSGPGSGDFWAGGAATLFNMTAQWDTHIRIIGATVSEPFQIVQRGRRIELIDCDLTNNLGIAPSNAQDIIYDTCRIPFIEVDKVVENATLTNCTIQNMQLQSASVMNLTMDRCQVSFGINGTSVRNLTVRDCRIGSINIFAEFGRSDTIYLEKNYIGAFQSNNSNNFILLTSITFSAGTFSILKSSPDKQAFCQLGIPGAVLYFSGAADANMGNPFIILGFREDATTIYMDTTLRALPVYTGATATSLTMHPATHITAIACTGCREMVELSEAPNGRPLFEYAHRTTMLRPPFIDNLWGTIVRISMNVRRAYTGAFNPYLAQIQFSTFTNNVKTSTVDFLDLRTVGERVYLPGSTTGSVGADGLSTLSTTAWFSNGFSWGLFSGDISAESPNLWPIVEVTAQTDQGLTSYGTLSLPTQQNLW